MATTTNYGWTTPDDTALVKDGAAAIRTLGSSVDTTVKNLNPETTLGDIRYRSSTSNVNTRLGIGTAGQVLSVSGGVPAWTTPASGGMTLISTTTLTGATVTLSSIPSGYNSLRIFVRNYKPSVDTEYTYMRVNNESGTFYREFTASSDNNAPNNTDTGLILARNDNSVSDSFYVIDIPDYANATTFKFLDVVGLSTNPTTTANINFKRVYSVYYKTTAITQLDFIVASGTFTSGTVLLYGVK